MNTWRLFSVHALALAGLFVAACGSKPEPVVLTDNQCIGAADTIKTLQQGDPLPRVVQVLGKPDRTYRVYAPFGRKYDVIEYKTGDSSCAKILLNAHNKKLAILFDEQGGMVGSGADVYRRMQQATTVRVTGTPINYDQIGE